MFRVFPILRRLLLLGAAFCALGGNSARALVGSESGANPFNGLYINQFVGAGAFYEQGFFGQDAVVANIEAGWVWNGHETLGNVSQYFYNPAAAAGETGQFDWHATMVGQAIAGSGLYTYEDGIAPGATLWSSAIATSWSGNSEYTGSFQVSDASLRNGYVAPLVTGVNGRHADVFNSSWGYDDPTGAGPETVMIDALIRAQNVVGVFAAGNSGPGGNTVVSPGAGFNGITVAALASDTSSPAYGTAASFSSAGPNDFYNPQTGMTTARIRPVVDLAAPGDNLTLAFYGGRSGGHISGTDPVAGAGFYYIPDMSGTSFAAPIVAGGAALLVDAAHAFGLAEMDDARVIKAVLMTSATKTVGWNNGQTLQNGVLRTTQALDYATGAGLLNLQAAYGVSIGDRLGPGILVAGLNTTAGLPGNGGGNVLPRGWDLGAVGTGAPTNYAFTNPLTAGELLTITLTWYADREFDLATNTSLDLSLANLALQVWATTAGGPTLIAESDAPVSTVEHLSFAIGEEGDYTIRVVWTGENYNLNNSAQPVAYALAWNAQPAPAPEPGALIFILAAGLAWGARRARRRVGLSS